MFTDRGGLSASSVGLILAIGFVMSVVFEIPTGIIADSMPRKYVLSLAIVSKIIALFAWLSFPFFWGYLLGSICFALGSAFESGALQAYLYGTLGEKHKKAFGKFWSRVSALVMVSYTSAYLLAGLIGARYDILLILSIAACVIGLIICITLPLDTLPARKSSQKPKILSSAVSFILKNSSLTSLLFGAIIVIALSEMMIEYVSLYYKQSGVPIRIIPLILGASNLVGAGLFWTLHSWETFLNKNKISLTIGILGLFLLSFYGGVVAVCAGAFLVIRFLRVLQVQFESNIQHLSNDEARATITSIGSFAAKLVAAGIIALIGVAAVNERIVEPMRIALIAGLLLFVGIQLLLSRRVIVR